MESLADVSVVLLSTQVHAGLSRPATNFNFHPSAASLTGAIGADYSYKVGRHSFIAHGKIVNEPNVRWLKEGFALKFKWSPWPESVARKTQIGARVPPNGAGQHHLRVMANATKLAAERDAELATLRHLDLNALRVDASHNALHTQFHAVGLSVLPRYA